MLYTPNDSAGRIITAIAPRVLDNPRHDEQLQDQAEHVGHREVLRVEVADNQSFAQAGRRSRGDNGGRVLLDDAAQDVLRIINAIRSRYLVRNTIANALLT